MYSGRFHNQNKGRLLITDNEGWHELGKHIPGQLLHTRHRPGKANDHATIWALMEPEMPRHDRFQQRGFLLRQRLGQQRLLGIALGQGIQLRMGAAAVLYLPGHLLFQLFQIFRRALLLGLHHGLDAAQRLVQAAADGHGKHHAQGQDSRHCQQNLQQQGIGHAGKLTAGDVHPVDPAVLGRGVGERHIVPRLRYRVGGNNLLGAGDGAERIAKGNVLPYMVEQVLRIQQADHQRRAGGCVQPLGHGYHAPPGIPLLLLFHQGGGREKR